MDIYTSNTLVLVGNPYDNLLHNSSLPTNEVKEARITPGFLRAIKEEKRATTIYLYNPLYKPINVVQYSSNSHILGWYKTPTGFNIALLGCAML